MTLQSANNECLMHETDAILIMVVIKVILRLLQGALILCIGLLAAADSGTNL